ncbi:MAG: hypothetical protein HN759_02165, partial [Akkermansiaceae bacterium]|nr:hypothetical protein [Akkermansiaceae bacterium]
KHVDGVDLIPFLRGEKKGDPHEYVFWLNNDPNDSKHRHLVAARWKQWRHYRKKENDSWQLFNLVKDPREEKDVASKFPEVVSNVDKQYTQWKATHAAPPKPTKFKDRNPGPVIPTRHGWVISDGRLKPKQEAKEKNSERR